MVRVLIFGTHPNQFNGYSKVIYELVKRTHGRPCADGSRVEMGVFGFQNYPINGALPTHRHDIPSDVYIFDAFANEEPKQQGFGIEIVDKAIAQFNPDVCIVYNDLLVVTSIVNKLYDIPNRKFKIVPYIDQVYLNQKKVYIDIVNAKADSAIVFTEHWKKIIYENGLTLDAHVLQHGFDPEKYYSIPREVARAYLGLDPKDFLILNLNRNQPRKRWDTCIKAFAEIVYRMPNEPIKLVIGTAIQGSWDLLEMYQRELKKRGISMQDGMKHIVMLDNPQKLTDFDVNVLYNVADIGINTCDGEGFGLCNFEQAAVGVPQVIPRLGGFLDFFTDDNAMFVEPSIAYYVDMSRDNVCGEALMVSYSDVVIAIENYYNDKVMLATHGDRCKKSIPFKYDWSKISDKLIDIIGKVTKTQETQETLEDIPILPSKFDSEPKKDESKSIEDVFSNKCLIEKKKNKKSSEKKMTKADLLRMREKIDQLLDA